MNKKISGFDFSLLHVDHVELNQKWNYTNVISPYFRIYYIDKGEGFVSTKSEKIKLEHGYLYIVPSFTLCHLSCKKYLSQYFIHFFEESHESISPFENDRRIIKVPARKTDVANVKRLLEINPGRGLNRSDNPSDYEKSSLYKSYKELNYSVSDSTYFETQGIILQLISRFLEARPMIREAAAPIPSKILEAIRHMQLNLNENITVRELAHRANLHQDYFSRLFLQHTGQRPLAFLHEKRIERAQYLIATTNLPYSEIAEKIGFENLSHFSKVFKKVTSLTPGEYKKQSGF